MWGSTQTIMMHFPLLPHCTMISKLWNNYSTMLRQHESLFGSANLQFVFLEPVLDVL